MPIDIPESASVVDNRSRIDVGREIGESNPFLRNSWLGGLVSAFSNRVYDFYFDLLQAIKEALPDTAKSNAARWGAIFGKTQLPATQATGEVAVVGTPGTLVPAGTIFVDSAGREYSTDANATLISRVLAVASITRIGSTATLTTVDDHGMTGIDEAIVVAGAVETEYNGVISTFTVTGLKTLTYEVSGSPSTPASGTITCTCLAFPIAVTSVEFGSEQNQLFGAELTLQSPIVNVQDVAHVNFGEISGGSDAETADAFKDRYLERIRNPIAPFNTPNITEVARSVAGVTRVFVQEITPYVGAVTVYFMRDNDDDPIPSASEIAAVAAAIETIRPAHTDPADVIVAAPTPISTNYVFTDLQPNTASMQAAVTASLEQFYAERTQVGQNIDEDAYRAAIFATIDITNGDVVTTFTLSGPAGDIVIAAGEIGQLGNITFP